MQSQSLSQRLLRLEKTEPALTVGQIQQEFSQLFALHTGIAIEKLEDTAALVFQALLDGCQTTFDEAIDLGLIAPLAAKQNLYHRYQQKSSRRNRAKSFFVDQTPKARSKSHI